MSLIRQLPRVAPRIATRTPTRAMSNTVARMAGGDAGAPRSGGSAQSDAFTKREKASEDLYVRQQEKEKLQALKKKIADQEAELAESRKQVESMQGEKN